MSGIAITVSLTKQISDHFKVPCHDSIKLKALSFVSTSVYLSSFNISSFSLIGLLLEENKQPTDLFLCRVHLVGAVCISNLSIGDL